VKYCGAESAPDTSLAFCPESIHGISLSGSKPFYRAIFFLLSLLHFGITVAGAVDEGVVVAGGELMI